MLCAEINNLMCQRLPKRLKPQTEALGAYGCFPTGAISSSRFQFNFQYNYKRRLQCLQGLFLYRAKNLGNLGLLALFFYFHIAHN